MVKRQSVWNLLRLGIPKGVGIRGIGGCRLGGSRSPGWADGRTGQSIYVNTFLVFFSFLFIFPACMHGVAKRYHTPTRYTLHTTIGRAGRRDRDGLQQIYVYRWPMEVSGSGSSKKMFPIFISISIFSTSSFGFLCLFLVFGLPLSKQTPTCHDLPPQQTFSLTERNEFIELRYGLSPWCVYACVCVCVLMMWQTKGFEHEGIQLFIISLDTATLLFPLYMSADGEKVRYMMMVMMVI
ncbi:hypothetical protein QBC40DRAFT_14418 [Triangularia verruculosa]|uniref:Uncharacterized protein n=1 Tax=Triangularia verruculosa TaxID=2587418 RepID=A0AAN6XC83_9PEZI|nr:hypothetical protein QBC40DRAFT_14418 [Triangularia verruculosa]